MSLVNFLVFVLSPEKMVGRLILISLGCGSVVILDVVEGSDSDSDSSGLVGESGSIECSGSIWGSSGFSGI